MKINEYRAAVDSFTPSADLKNRIISSVNERRVRVFRPFAVCAAVALMVVLFAGAVIAASPEIREEIVSFFKGERVPELPVSTSEPYVEVKDLGGVEATYIRYDGWTIDYVDGLIRETVTVGEDEDAYSRPGRFWKIENGLAIQVPIEVHRADIDISYGGYDYSDFFFWYKYNGELYVYDASYHSDSYASVAAVNPVDGDTVLLELSHDYWRDFRVSYLLYDIITGEAVDFLAECGAENILNDYHLIRWNSDMSGALIECGYEPEDTVCYYLDLKAKTTTELADLTGVDVKFCHFIDDNTFKLFEYSEEGILGTAYSYDLTSGKLTKVLDKGSDFTLHGAGRYDLLVDKSGGVQIIDLMTGDTKSVEGMKIDKKDIDDARYSFSRCGDTKFWYHDIDTDSERGWRGINRLGLIDAETGSYTYFDRIDYDKVGIREYLIGPCAGENKLMIEGQSEDYMTKVIYLYEFKNTD